MARAVRALKIALEHGFTTMRDLETEGASYDDVALKEAVNEGVIPGPRLFVAGPALSTTGSYPILRFRPDWRFPTGVQICDGADGCRRAVREQLSYGTDWVKVYANTGGLRVTPDGYVDSPPNWTREELAAVVSEAHGRGVKVAAHATSDTGTRIAIEAGVDSIEHGTSIRPERAREMAAKGIFLSPTLTVMEYVAEPRAREGRAIWAELPKIRARSLENCRKAGVKVAFGTDAGGFPWTEIPQAREFEHEVRLGMSPLEAIRSATTVAAELLGLAGKAGRDRDRGVRRPRRRARRSAQGRRRPFADRLRDEGRRSRSPIPPRPEAVMRIGLTGGLASGKSTVAAILRELGATVFDADEIVSDLYEPGGPGESVARGALRKRRGGRAAARSTGRRSPGSSSRDPAARRALEAGSILSCGKRSNSVSREAERLGFGVAVAEASQLLEAGIEDRYDRVLLVVAPEAERIRRWSGKGRDAADARRRMAGQISAEDARPRVTDVIVNDGSLEDLRTRVEEVFGRWAK